MKEGGGGGGVRGIGGGVGCGNVPIKNNANHILFQKAKYMYLEKTADISRRHHWFLRKMTSEKRAQKFHTDDVSLPSSGQCF